MIFYNNVLHCDSCEQENTVNNDMHFISWDNPPKHHPHYQNLIWVLWNIGGISLRPPLPHHPPTPPRISPIKASMIRPSPIFPLPLASPPPIPFLCGGGCRS